MRIFITILLSTHFFISVGQYRFDHLGINDGLSQSSVNDIYQDSHGFLWFATQDGLNKFDGYEFEYFNKESEPALAGNFLWSIVEDPNGNIWTASATGATRLDWKNGKSTKFYFDKKERNLSQKNQVSTIKDLGSKMLIAFDGKGSFSIDYNAFSDSAEVELTEEYVYYPNELKARNYLYDLINVEGVEVSIHFKHVMVDGDSIPLPSSFTTSNFRCSTYPWESGFFLTTSDGLLFFDLTKKSLTKTSIRNPTNDIIQAPSQESLWIATDEGIQLYDPYSDESNSIKTNDENISNAMISSFYKSKDGIYWIGTANGGINIYDQKIDRFKFLNQSHGLSGKPIWSIAHLGEKLLLGSDDGIYLASLSNKLTSGIFASNAVKELSKLDISEANGTRIASLEKISSHEFLFGTTKGLIGRVNLKSGTIETTYLKGKPIISDIINAGESIWVTTHNEYYQLNANLETLFQSNYINNPKRDPTNYYLSGYLSRDSTLWLGSNVGFSYLTTTGEKTNVIYDENNPLRSPNHYFVTGFYEDNDGLIWMSTFGGGVSCFDRSTQEFFHISMKDGLINNTCSSIQGNGSHVFVGTNGGLSVIEIETRKIRNFTKADGLLSNEFAIGSSGMNGPEVFFGVIDGLVALNGDKIDIKDSPLPSSVIGIDINYNSAPFSTISNSKLDLYPSDKIFSLSFSDLSYRKRDQIGYEYKLEGFNSDWIAVNSSNRRATYSLSPDEYNFKVRTVLDGIKSEPTTLGITVHPAFYQTWWFISFSILGSILLIVIVSRFYSHQTLKEKLRKLEVQQKIQSERERISRDLHDNVGSQITYIASSLDNLSSNGDVSEVKELGEFTRDTMRQLRETIWVINHDEVTVEELKNKVIDYLSEILKNFPKIVHDVSFPESDLKFNPTKAINIFRIIQEGVNNAIKHAEPKKIEVQLLIGEENSITISDDGKGFSGEDKSGHFGLMNMRSRAQEIGGLLQLKSSSGLGTSIIVSGFKIGQMT